MGGSNENVAVEVVIDDGTAVEGIDYAGHSQNITFSNGENNKNISITALNNGNHELMNKTFGLLGRKIKISALFMSTLMVKILEKFQQLEAKKATQFYSYQMI